MSRRNPTLEIKVVSSSSDNDDDSASSSLPDTNCDISILGELVGARRLMPEDETTGIKQSIRPFCVIKWNERIIHTTKCEIGCNPIWTMSSGSFFLLNLTTMSDGILSITVYSPTYGRSITSSTKLDSYRMLHGQVNLNSNAILSHCDETRFEMDLRDEDGSIDVESRGKLALRFRIASESDQRILSRFSYSDSGRSRALGTTTTTTESSLLLDDLRGRVEKGKIPTKLAKLVTETPRAKIATNTLEKSIRHIFDWGNPKCEKTNQSKYRIKPYPDPDRAKDTTFMTPTQIISETQLPSKQWINCGTGTLGKLYVEILSCHGLPNVDVGGEAVGNLTDPFVSIVYEDSCAMTDVIDDELSPHWLPWTQRAFCFGIICPTSSLYLGVFDHDLKIGDYDPIGRVAVNVSNLRRNTSYNLKYNLYPSTNFIDRTAVGSIQIRIRLECLDERKFLLETLLKPRPRIHVNVKNERTFKVVRYTFFGEHDNEEKFDLKVARSYMYEFLEYQSNLSYIISDSIQSLMFWRNDQVKVYSFNIPLHSFFFFVSVITLVEYPHLIVSFLLIGVAWVMLASLTIRRQHPSPWHSRSCPPFWQFLSNLLQGSRERKLSVIEPPIEPYEGNEAVQEYDLKQKRRLEEDRKVAEKRVDLQQKVNAVGDTKISTPTSSSSGIINIQLNLLNSLGRYQGMVGGVFKSLRFIKMIVTWDESVLSFWITLLFLITGIVSLLLPWRFILAWTARSIAWGLFGPHMKLVDQYFNNCKHSDKMQMMKRFDEKSQKARLRHEEAIKTKDLKSLAFGKFCTLVPSYNLACQYDRPLPESWSEIVNEEIPIDNNSDESLCIPGQQFYGSMIPKLGQQGDYDGAKKMPRVVERAMMMNKIRKRASENGPKLRRIAKLVILKNKIE